MNNINNENLINKLQHLNKSADFSTIELWYDTVVVIKKSKGERLRDLFKKEIKVWIKLCKKVKLGIKVQDIKWEIAGNKIKCCLPAVKLLGEPVTIDKKRDEDDYPIIMTKDDLLFKNPIEVEERSEMIKEANEELKNKVKEYESLFEMARSRTRTLIENFVKQILVRANLNYDLEFVEQEKHNNDEIISSN